MRRAIVICPGRGSYTKAELGYLGRHHADKRELLEELDDQRRGLGQDGLLALDGASSYSLTRHTRGGQRIGADLRLHSLRLPVD